MANNAALISEGEGDASDDNENDAYPSLNEGDWHYLAEGKLHMILKYRGSHPNLRHHVIRALKTSEGKGELKPYRERRYMEAVMQPFLSHYLDPGTGLSVSMEFLAALDEKVSPHRPLGRARHGLDLCMQEAQCLKDWTSYFPTIEHHALIVDASSPAVTIELKPKAGYRSRSYLVDPEHRIKYQYCRYELMQRYRYALKLTEAIDPEWGQSEQINLKYSPLDLYVNDLEARRKALKAITYNPHNFLQMFLDSTHVYGRGKEDLAEAHKVAHRLLSFSSSSAASTTTTVSLEEGTNSHVLDGAFTAVSLDEGENGGDLLESMLDLLAEILHQEPVLGRLLALQEMDILDVEGAALVMKRLIALCDRKEEDALRALHEAELTVLDHEYKDGIIMGEEANEETMLLVEHVLTGHPSSKEIRLADMDGSDVDQRRKEEAMQAINSLKEETRLLEDVLAAHPSSKGICLAEMDASELDQRREEAMRAVVRLIKPQAIELLRRWLISLGACDASIMISLRRLSMRATNIATNNEEKQREQERFSSSSASSSAAAGGGIGGGGGEGGGGERGERSEATAAEEVEVAPRLQSHGQPGIIQETRSGVMLAYYIQMVDLGPKPPAKILSKAFLEKEIIRLASSLSL